MMLRLTIILGSLLLTCGVSLLLKENYPFSHFPMYSDPSANRYYFWLATPDQKPLPVQTLTGKTAAQLGKILRSYTDKRVDALKLKHRDQLPDAERAAAGAEILTFLRQEAATLKQTLPPKLAIMRTDIAFVQGATRETPSVWYVEP
jgi:hypothetical protein